MNSFKPGDAVVIRYPGMYERTGVVVELDHGLSVEPTVRVRWIDTPGGEHVTWFLARFVFPKETQ